MKLYCRVTLQQKTHKTGKPVSLKLLIFITNLQFAAQITLYNNVINIVSDGKIFTLNVYISKIFIFLQFPLLQ